MAARTLSLALRIGADFGEVVKVYFRDLGRLLFWTVAFVKALGGDLASRCPPWQACARSEEVGEQKLQDFSVHLTLKDHQGPCHQDQ